MRETSMLLGLAALLMPTSALAQGGLDEWIIVPGERVGPITLPTTHQDLVRAFGQNQVARSEIYLGEGEWTPGTVLFPGTPNEVEIVWKDSRALTCPGFVIVRGLGSSWLTDQGIRIGTTLEELEDLNGRPFTFAGLDFDLGGTVMSWEEGRLAVHDGSSLVVRLGYRVGTTESGVSPVEYLQITGDRPVSSDHPTARKLGLEVMSMESRWGWPFSWSEAERSSGPWCRQEAGDLVEYGPVE